MHGEPQIGNLTTRLGWDFLGWPLKPFEKYYYIGSLIKAIKENIKYPRGLPSF